MKQDERYTFDRSSLKERRNGQHSYIYSESAANFIVDEITKDPENVIRKLKEKISRMQRQ